MYIWMPPTLSDLTPNISNMELTHLGSEALIFAIIGLYTITFTIYNSHKHFDTFFII